MDKFGVISKGITCPIIREGDDLVNIVVDSVLSATKRNFVVKGLNDHDAYDINDKDVIGITESVVARAAGEYITVDDIAADIKKKYGEDAIIILEKPIYSRNRFSMILKGIARAAKGVAIFMPREDEVGNPRGVNPFTGVDIEKYYKEICASENCSCECLYFELNGEGNNVLNCELHYSGESKLKKGAKAFYTLKDICSDKSPDWGVLGTNKATEEKLKLFPSASKSYKFVTGVQEQIKAKTGKHVEVMIYGDGCFHSPYLYDNGVRIEGTSINEFADPVTSPAYTVGLEGTPNEIKIKYLADDKFKDLKGKELDDAIENEIKSIKENLKGKMVQEGCTPRRYVDLLASLMDLTSGSGSRATPIVLVQNYL